MRSTNRRCKRAVAGAALAILAITLPATTEAKTPHAVSATVSGKRVKWKGRLVRVTDSTSGFILVATKLYATKTIGVGCGILLAGQTFPLTMTMGCNMNYAVHKHGGEIWLNTGLDPNNPMTVTFASFDGTVVQGTFSGVLTSATLGGSTLSIQGSFDAALTQ
jgi:hypothetical protein